jgi:hypothetical protein
MTDVATVPGAPIPASVEQLAVPRAMIAATEPYHLAKRLVSTFDEALEIFDSDIVRVDDRQQLICLQNARTEAARWRLGYRARDQLRDLPPYADVQAAHHAIRRDLTTEPSIEHRVELVTMMLDVQGIAPELSYIQYLAWKLGDVPRRKTETRKRYKRWFSMVTITRTIDEVLMTLKPEEGRPVPIADVLDVAGRHASELTGLDQSIVNLANTIIRLNQIVDATKDAKKPPDRPEPAVATDDDDSDIIPF